MFRLINHFSFGQFEVEIKSPAAVLKSDKEVRNKCFSSTYFKACPYRPNGKFVPNTRMVELREELLEQNLGDQTL